MSTEYPSKEVIETHDNSRLENADLEKGPHHPSFSERVRHSISVQSIDESSVEGQIFSMNSVDPALDKKMRLVNNVRVTISPPPLPNPVSGAECQNPWHNYMLDHLLPNKRCVHHVAAMCA